MTGVVTAGVFPPGVHCCGRRSASRTLTREHPKPSPEFEIAFRARNPRRDSDIFSDDIPRSGPPNTRMKTRRISERSGRRAAHADSQPENPRETGRAGPVARAVHQPAVHHLCNMGPDTGCGAGCRADCRAGSLVRLQCWMRSYGRPQS